MSGTRAAVDDELAVASMSLAEMVDVFNLKARLWNHTMKEVGELTVKHTNTRTTGFIIAVEWMRLSLGNDARELCWLYEQMKRRGLPTILSDSSGNEVSMSDVEAINEFAELVM